GFEIGHYAGHQIGVAVNEAPRLVPYDETPIRAGMVFSIEPGAYEGEQGDTGARMEKSVIVHESGPEIICDFEWGI
nr:M24 family metallopeptidase [Anaerolineae bacterium]